MTKRDRTEAPSLSTTTNTPPDPPARARPVEEHLAGLPAWQAAAVRAAFDWPAGKPLSDEQFKAARDQVLNEVIR